MAARRDYGVVVKDGVIDDEETRALRATRSERLGFDPGEARRAHEARWDAATYAQMHELLATLPVSWRAPVKKRLFAAVRESEPTKPAADVIRESFAAYLESADIGV